MVARGKGRARAYFCGALPTGQAAQGRQGLVRSNLMPHPPALTGPELSQSLRSPRVCGAGRGAQLNPNGFQGLE